MLEVFEGVLRGIMSSQIRSMEALEKISEGLKGVLGGYKGLQVGPLRVLGTAFQERFKVL